jgi:hypothetical protein
MSLLRAKWRANGSNRIASGGQAGYHPFARMLTYADACVCWLATRMLTHAYADVCVCWRMQAGYPPFALWAPSLMTPSQNVSGAKQASGVCVLKKEKKSLRAGVLYVLTQALTRCNASAYASSSIRQRQHTLAAAYVSYVRT